MRTLRGPLGLWLLCAVLGLGMLVGRVVSSAREHLALGERSYRGGDWPGALREWGRAARYQAPGNAYAAAALRALLALGREAEGPGPRADREVAKRAYMEVRSALLGSRHVYTPEAALLQEANQRLAALWAQEEGGGEERRAWHAAKLAPDATPLPSPAWSLLAVLGAGVLVGGMAGLLRRGLDANGRIASRAALLRWAGVTAAGLVGMLLGLWRA